MDGRINSLLVEGSESSLIVFGNLIKCLEEGLALLIESEIGNMHDLRWVDLLLQITQIRDALLIKLMSLEEYLITEHLDHKSVFSREASSHF